MRRRFVFVACGLSLVPWAACAPADEIEIQVEQSTCEAPRFELLAQPEDQALTRALEPAIQAGIRTVEAYFARPFPEEFSVELFPDRARFDASFPPEWGMERTECWMVATGVAEALRMLSPRAWADEACEHDAEDPEHVRGIVVHELTHVFHGQQNPTRDFVGAEELGWFAEGLAVVVSGQIHEKRADARAAVEGGLVPERLAQAWSGSHRYGVCGSLVEYVESLVGREGLLEALAFTEQSQLLDRIGLAEEDLLGGWTEYALDSIR